MNSRRNPESIICKTLLTMGETTPLLRIKVKDLCAEAGVTRTCFYTYFDSIYSVVQKIEDDFFDGLIEEGNIAYPYKFNRDAIKQPVLSSILIAGYLEKNKEICRVLWGSNGDIAFQMRLLNYIRKGIERVLNEASLFNTEAEKILACEFISNGILGLVKQRATANIEMSINEWSLIVTKLLYKCII